MIAIDLVRRINQTLLEKFRAGSGLGIATPGQGALCWLGTEGVLAGCSEEWPLQKVKRVGGARTLPAGEVSLNR